jgi:hypothetical protein
MNDDFVAIHRFIVDVFSLEEVYTLCFTLFVDCENFESRGKEATAGWRAWLAPDSIRPGERWVDAINRGLEESTVFALVLTPAAVASRWVNIETNVALEMEVEGAIQFVPLEVELCPIPPMWRAYQRIPFEGGYHGGLVELLQKLGRAADG